MVEVFGQLTYLAIHQSYPVTAFSVILISSVATFWKVRTPLNLRLLVSLLPIPAQTVCYMGIMIFAPDPLKHMPSLTCFEKWTSNCPADFVKFRCAIPHQIYNESLFTCVKNTASTCGGSSSLFASSGCAMRVLLRSVRLLQRASQLKPEKVFLICFYRWKSCRSVPR